MIEGITSSGFEYKISEDIADDFELVELLAELEDGSIKNLPYMFKKVLGGEKDFTALKKHVKKANGYISTKALMEELKEILNGNKETKNS